VPDYYESIEVQLVLRQGAEIGLARAIAEGRSDRTVADFVEARLGGLSQGQIDYIQDLARAILAAADTITSSDPDEPIDPDGIPTTPDPTGEDWTGHRLFWFGEWLEPGGTEWKRFSGTLPDITDFADIVAFAAELASGYIGQYPEKFGSGVSDTGEGPRVRIIGATKGF
jgi:hypothetical protein